MPAFEGYCTKGDVTSHVTIFADDLSATSNPTEAAVDGWISSAGIEINAALDALGYETPVNATTSPNAHQLLKGINALQPAAFLEMALSSSTTAPNAKGREADLIRQYNTQMKLLRDGHIRLSDAVPTPDVILHESDESPGHHLNDPALGLTEDDVAPDFTRDQGVTEY